jgi:hypothetical protein
VNPQDVVKAVFGAGISGVVCLGIAGLIAIIVYGVMLSAKHERQRREKLLALASARGATFHGEFPGIDQVLPAFPMLGRGHSRRAFNIASASFPLGGIPCACLWGEYQYKITTTNGKRTQTTTYTHGFVAVQPALAAQEELRVRREGFLDWLGEFVGVDDIDFESAEFSKRFHVKCSDRRFAFDLFDPMMMEFFLAGDPPPVHLFGNWMLFERGSARWEPEQFESQLAWIDAFLARVPRHLRAARLPKELHPHDPVLSPTGPAGGGLA